jgi:hypothetical protein
MNALPFLGRAFALFSATEKIDDTDLELALKKCGSAGAKSISAGGQADRGASQGNCGSLL